MPRRRRVVGFYTDRRGRVRPVTVGARRRRGTIFFPPRYKRYAEIVRIDNPEAARGSVEILAREFREAGSVEKRRRIKRMMVLAANRAAAAARKRDLSDRERREFLEVERIYREAYRGLRI
jgi:hypothetical protein